MRFGDRAAACGLILIATLPAIPVNAQPDAAAGGAIAAQCSACHGSDGISADTSTPNLAGQHFAYLLNQLNAYKTGVRQSPIMHEMVASLSQQQIEDLAAYYAAIPIRVGSNGAGK